ncbi:hypothetical protein RJ640_015721 [Escallonia rubra]|uniref:Uncharacterized protein n=1 Tax=Escallonia rubra TaxID=112253 RepID=A0AA88UWB9_9ASTE|nr:hypothetical protein RJ640_015721 [Escallonia rubra]
MYVIQNSKPKIKKVCLEKIEGQYDNYRLLYARDDRESSILKEVPVVIMSSENIPTRINKSSNVHAKTPQTSRHEEIERSIDEARELTPLEKLEQMHKHV